MKAIRLMLVLWGLIAAGVSWAGVMSDADLKRLPPYCHARLNTSLDSPESKAWFAAIGSNYLDFYHYCGGLNLMNHYWSARNAKERTAILQQAKGEFDYMVSHERPDFTMRADLYTNRGEVLWLMKKAGEAIRDLNTAISADPKKARAYALLADVHMGSKDRAKALEVIAQGLRFIPDSKALRRRYLELGGKEPFPEPLPEARAESAAVKPADQVQPAPKTEPAAAKPAKDSAGPQEPQNATNEVQEKPETASQIGNRKNPYCRFCPPE